MFHTDVVKWAALALAITLLAILAISSGYVANDTYTPSDCEPTVLDGGC